MYINSRERHIQDDLVARGIRDTKVLEAFRAVPREFFVPPDYVDESYADSPIPIGYSQTISQPYIVALMSELLQLKPESRVLEIGTGSGYQAAILSRLCRQVFSIEVIEALYHAAFERLQRLSYDNIQLKLGDGYLGWPENAPFDGIIVTCAPEHIPPPLLQQLAGHGRMVIPVGPTMGIQELVLVETEQSKQVQRSVIPVAFVPLVRKRERPE